MASKSNEINTTPEENELETTTEEISVAETTTNNTIETSDEINYIITSCTPKDMKDDVFVAEKPFLNWDTEAEENLSEFHKSVAGSEVTIIDAKSEACDDTEEYMGEFYSEQVIQQNKMLSELNTACEGIFRLDRELSANESGVLLKAPLSEAISLSITACPSKITPRADNGCFMETSYVVAPSEANSEQISQTFFADLQEEQAVGAKKQYAVVEHVLNKKENETLTYLDENPTRNANEIGGPAFEENAHQNVLCFSQNSNAFRGSLVHYTTERLEDIARRNYEAARAVFKSKENQCLQNASLEIAIKNIFNNKAETTNELEKAVNDEDFSILFQNSTTTTMTNELQQSKRKESSISFDSWMLSQRTDAANKRTPHSEYAMDSAKTRKTVKRPVPQVSDRVSLKQFVTPEGLEESREEKKPPNVEDAKERGDEPTVQKKPAVMMSYEDLMRVLASPTSECSIFTTDAAKANAADGLHSSPSDSRLLKREQQAAVAAAAKKAESAPKVKNLEEELHYHNPFQAVFRRAGFTDVNQLYRFMDYECEEDLEELQKPLPENYIGDLIKKIQETDKQIRAMHKELFESGFMVKLAPFFARCKKMRDGNNSESGEEEEEEDDDEDDDEDEEEDDDEEEEEESSSEGAKSVDD